MASVNLYTVGNGGRIQVEGLGEPVQNALPLNYSLGAVCVFLGEEQAQWVSDGTVELESEGGLLVPTSNYLTLFGAILAGPGAASSGRPSSAACGRPWRTGRAGRRVL